MFVVFCMLCKVSSYAQQIPIVAAPQTRSVIIWNATAHLGDGNRVENAAIGFRNGKIDWVSPVNVADTSRYERVINATGMHVYPGFIASNSTLGLMEIDQVKATADLEETGTYKPSVRSAIAYNAESEIIPTVRSNGVLIGQIVPRGGVISGTSSVMQFDAWNWEDALISEDEGVHLHWPTVFHKHFDKGKVSVERVKSYEQQLREIHAFFEEARSYAASPRMGDFLSELRFEAMLGVLNGKQTLYVHADDIKSILESLNFKDRFGVARMVIVGGYDAHWVAEELVKRDVPVQLRRIHELPVYDHDDIDLPYRLPQLLWEKGVEFCFQNEGDMERMGARNLPFHAGTAVAYGLPYEQAVKALTGSAAKILRLEHRLGTLTPGKDATLFISAGDALDMRTHQVTKAFIEGRDIDLSNKHTELYEKYKNKYGQD
jgi:imidazolonepropionase-like amidohydrolase